MAAIVKVLTPAEIDAADYPIAQNPSLGGELNVWLTTKLPRLIGIAFLSGDATVQYEYINLPTLPLVGPLVAFVYDELRSGAAAVLTYGDLTGTFTPVGYARNRSFDFGTGRGVELAGPNVVVPDADTVASITNAKRGSKIGIYEMPVLADYVKVGSARSKDITIPVKKGKNMLSGMDSNRYNKKGVANEAKLKFSALDENPDDSVQRFAGQTCCAMLERWKEEKLLVERSFCINFVPGRNESNPEGDGETMLDAEGTFQHYIQLPAP